MNNKTNLILSENKKRKELQFTPISTKRRRIISPTIKTNLFNNSENIPTTNNNNHNNVTDTDLSRLQIIERLKSMRINIGRNLTKQELLTKLQLTLSNQANEADNLEILNKTELINKIITLQLSYTISALKKIKKVDLIEIIKTNKQNIQSNIHKRREFMKESYQINSPTMENVIFLIKLI